MTTTAAPPKPRNGRTKTATPPKASTAKEPKPRIAKFLPDAEYVKVYKVDMGHRRFIKNYSARDLARSSDIEVFIQQHVMPIAGEGDYDVDVIDGKNEHKRTVPVSVIDPSKPPPGMTGVQAQESMVLGKFLERVDKLEAAALAPPPASKSFAEQIQEIAQVKGMLGIEEKSANDPMTPMLLMMMMNKPQDVPVASKTALEFAELRADLKNAVEAMERAPAQLPPPLPMPAPPDPNAGLAEVVKALGEVTKKNDDVKITDLVTLLKPEKPEKKWGIAEIGSVVAMVTPIIEKVFGDKKNPELDYMKEQLRDMREEARDARRGGGIQGSIQDLSAVMGLARNLAGGDQTESSFWSFANRIIDNAPAFADSLGGMMNSIREDEKKTAPRSTNQGEAPAADDDSEVLEFPDGFEKKVEVIAKAPDAAGRVGATLMALQFLGQTNAGWRKYLTGVVQMAKDGKKDEVMEFLESFLTALNEREWLTVDDCEATMEAFDNNYERAVGVLTGGKAKPTQEPTPEPSPG